jgi:hypothetical protein
MLSEQSFALVDGIAATLAKQNIALNPSNNTYLSELFRTSLSSLVPSYEFAITNGPIGKETEHDLLQDKMIAILSKSVSAQISFIRNEIIPEIDEIYNETKTMLASFLNNDPVGNINIESVDLPEVLSNPIFDSEFKKYEGLSPVKPISNIGINSPTAELIQNIRMAAKDFYQGTRSGSLEYFDSLSDEQIRGAVYDMSQELNSVDRHDRITKAFNAYLLTKLCIGNQDLAMDIFVPDNLSHLTNFLSASMKYHVPNILLNKEMLNKLISNPSSSMLVLSVNDESKVIRVNGPVYRQWLLDGGDNKVLYGLLVNPNRSPMDFTVASLSANKIKNINYWDHYLVLFNANTSTNLYNSFNSYFSSVFYSHIAKNKSAFEKEHESITPGSPESIKAKFTQELKKTTLLNISDDKSMYDTIVRIVCKSRFYYTDSYRILTTMVAESKDGVENDASALATLAVIYYLVDYFAEQLDIIR